MLEDKGLNENKNVTERQDYRNNTQKDKIERLNKFLADIGICSRREADRLIQSGAVKVNGDIAKLGDKINYNDEIRVNNKLVNNRNIKKIYFAFNKPRGIVTTTAKSEPNNIIEYIDYPERIFPVGRLDKDSEGLIILTNDGSIVNKIMKSAENKEKEYLVRVDNDITNEFKKNMESGVKILDRLTKPAKFKQVDTNTFKLVISEGMNRQIRRMCETLGYNVISLKRLRIMNITLGNLKPGEYREITYKELKQLKELLNS